MLAVHRERTHDLSAVIWFVGFIMFRMIGSMLVLLGALAVPATAFEQTNEVPKAVTSEDGAASTVPDGSGVELTVPEASVAEDTGPTISLPGIGTIGTLPKFDFGLELLYGDDNSAAVVDDKAVENDLRIRGSVKHKF